jgi:hypothetical protein
MSPALFLGLEMTVLTQRLQALIPHLTLQQAGFLVAMGPEVSAALARWEESQQLVAETAFR